MSLFMSLVGLSFRALAGSTIFEGGSRESHPIPNLLLSHTLAHLLDEAAQVANTLILVFDEIEVEFNGKTEIEEVIVEGFLARADHVGCLDEVARLLRVVVAGPVHSLIDAAPCHDLFEHVRDLAFLLQIPACDADAALVSGSDAALNGNCNFVLEPFDLFVSVVLAEVAVGVPAQPIDRVGARLGYLPD